MIIAIDYDYKNKVFYATYCVGGKITKRDKRPDFKKMELLNLNAKFLVVPNERTREFDEFEKIAGKRDISFIRINKHKQAQQYTSNSEYRYSDAMIMGYLGI